MLLQAENLTMAFPDGDHWRTIFEDVSFSVPSGGSLALTGVSGCGKSTILNILGGLIVPTAGRVLIEGKEISGLSLAQQSKLRSQRIGFIFQEWNLVSYLSALDNVALPLQLTGERRHKARRRAHDALQHVGMDSLASSFPENLSGGEQQRVAVARALVGDTVMVLADEPTGSLDVHNSQHVIDLLLERSAQQGLCCVIATHDLDIAQRCDHILDVQQHQPATGGEHCRPVAASTDGRAVKA
ncbi:Lipoprotein-releasing system ATP-binding protein LolD [Austwickia sp. TVS 96-490-7B]|uniref:ABC transporter ATP-binding protein n=1 Tax=Austwickia sp. TVS 96-490-7B TaxID=2830843 RepID=UPI001C5A13DF|nr:ABC transporter ATP-binding protein [Austwickia sp. TVS 96-490-7B]MBW3085297.1 Lipoprotein-releasing system ATP-binding protein LolD [Austwickia sp. TVS 96-490-7B]